VLDDFAFGQGQDFLAALSANYTYLSPTLPRFYGLKSAGTGFQRVEFAPGHPRERSGLCESLELPAGLLDSIGDELVGLTRIQIIDKRNEQAARKAVTLRSILSALASRSSMRQGASMRR
jgi:hypothetical protein